MITSSILEINNDVEKKKKRGQNGLRNAFSSTKNGKIFKHTPN